MFPHGDLCVIVTTVQLGSLNRPSTSSEPAPDLIRGRTKRTEDPPQRARYAKVSLAGQVSSNSQWVI